MRKFVLSLIIIAFTVPLLSSCDYHDINRRLFIVEMGIDSVKTDEIIGVSFKGAIPSGGTEGGGEKQQKFATYYIEAPSIGEALRKLKTQTSLEPDYAHLKLILVGKKFAENYPVHSIVNYYVRKRDTQNISYFIIGDPVAKGIVFSTSKDANVPGSELFLKFGQGTKSPYSQETYIFEIYRSIYTPGETPYCPVATIENGKVVVNKVAVFGRDFKIKYIMSPEETETFKILTNSAKTTFITLQTASHKPYGAELENVGTKVKFSRDEDNSIVCNVGISGIAMLEETPKTFQNLEELSYMFSSQVSKKALSLIDKLQHEELDPVNFIKNYYSSNSSFDFTNDWPTGIFPKIKFDVNTKIKFQNTGTLQ